AGGAQGRRRRPLLRRRRVRARRRAAGAVWPRPAPALDGADAAVGALVLPLFADLPAGPVRSAGARTLLMSDVGFLRLEGLTRRFGARVAVDGLTLDVGRGEVFGFLGPNGAGKSTTFHLLTGLLAPDGGRVLLDGVPAPP